MSYCLVVYSDVDENGHVKWDIYPEGDVIGVFDVQQSVEVRFLGDQMLYKAKILCIGSKEYCEQRSAYVGVDGTLKDVPFSMAPAKHAQKEDTRKKSTARVAVKPAGKSDSEKLDFLIGQVIELHQRQDVFEKKLDEVIRIAKETQNASEGAVLAVESMQSEHKKLAAESETIRKVVVALNDKIPSNHLDEIDWNLFPQDRVELLAAENSECTKFALKLERILFAGDTDYFLAIEQRFRSTEKLRFLRNCVKAFYYKIPNAWEQARRSINKDIARRRAATASVSQEHGHVGDSRELFDQPRPRMPINPSILQRPKLPSTPPHHKHTSGTVRYIAPLQTQSSNTFNIDFTPVSRIRRAVDFPTTSRYVEQADEYNEDNDIPMLDLESEDHMD